MIIAMMLGVLWGLIEAFFGGFLHAFMMGRISGYILGSLGMFILYFGWRKKLKYDQIILIGIVAGGLKFFSVVIFPAPLLSPQIIKPVMSILTQSFAFTFTAMFLDDALPVLKNYLKIYSPSEMPALVYLKYTLATILIALSIIK